MIPSLMGNRFEINRCCSSQLNEIGVWWRHENSGFIFFLDDVYENKNEKKFIEIWKLLISGPYIWKKKSK